MFPKMRRLKNAMSEEDTYNLLERCPEGVIGTISENGYPYTVPVNYVFYNSKIYFHCAKTGHKLANIKENNKVSFTAYDNVKVIEKEFTTKYQSVVVFGEAVVIPGSVEILNELIKKYSKHFIQEGIEYVKKDFSTTYLVEITINHITGKERL